MVPELNPSNKENPFDLADDTAYERDRYSHQKIGKYSTVIERVRSSKGNKVNKHISVNISNNEKFGSPSFDKIFQDFFIVGVDHKRTLRYDDNDRTDPKILYSYMNYTNKEDRERVDAIRDFCFPDGLQVEEIDPDDSKYLPDIEDVLYSKHPYRRNSFVFTLNNTENKEGGAEYINFLCIRFTDLVKCKKKVYKSGIYLTKKAYCFKFDHSCYELVLDIANALISMMKDSWVHELNRLSTVDSHYGSECPLGTELNAYLRNSVVTGEMKNLLDDFNSYDFSQHEGSDIEYRAQGNIMTIQYTKPTLKEYSYFDAKWFCPIFFKNISLDMFLKTLYAVMLEKTVVFVSKDIQYSSCAVLAMKALIEPFKICFAMIPVMPQHVIDYLSAPVPLLIGLSTQLLRNNKLDYFDATCDLNEEINWINLDDEHYSLWGTEDFPIPHLSGLKENIQDDYEFIRNHSKNLVEYQNDEVDRKVKNIANVIRETIYEHFIKPLPSFSKRNDYVSLNQPYSPLIIIIYRVVQP